MKLNNQAPPQARFIFLPQNEGARSICIIIVGVLLLLHSDRGVLNTTSAACWIHSSTIFTTQTLRIQQTAHLRMATWSRSAMSNFSHKKPEVFIVWSFSATHFSSVALRVRFFSGEPSVDDDLDDDDLVLTCPDIATAQYKFYLYTSQFCPLTVWLPDVIASTAM